MVSFEECTGCSACFAICAHNAITMRPNKGGFLHPKIDESKCVKCGLCDKVCESANEKSHNQFIDIYALKHKDKEIVKTSTSGGAFKLFANHILSLGGVVYGAAYNDDFAVTHIRCESIEDLCKLQKSKYVQSDNHLIYEAITQDLKDGKAVLYSGTACQCSGILAYAQRRKLNTDSLYTCDLICHGTPSPQIWMNYLKYRKKQGGEIESIDFRNKERSWRDFRMAISYKNGKTKTFRQNEDLFMVLFFHDYILRNSCYQCKFSNLNRKADFTLGDFWGLEEFYPEFNDDKGTSVLLLNTSRGKDLFDKVQSECEYINIKENELTLRQPNLRRPSHKNPKYDKFWADYTKYGFEDVTKRYADNTLLGQLKRRYLFKILYYSGIFKLLLKLKRG